jgi:starch synthase
VNILLAASEVVPFSKTGGLADVCAALPAELARLGHHVAIITPAYRSALAAGLPLEATDVELEIPIGSRVVHGRVLKSRLPGASVPVYLVEQPDYFDRPQLYRENNEDYRDNCERFVFFSRAVMESIKPLKLNVDILHLNDWQTGLIAAYLQTEYRGVPGYDNIATVFTIHNLAYQGRFWHWDMLLTGLDWKYFNWHQMEFYGDLSLMKTGIVFADAITTVSPRYAEEIQAPPLGCGLEGVLQNRASSLHGILNGVDYATWDPQKDPHLAANYNLANWREGKAKCKAALQKELNLPTRTDVPLVGFIGRLDSQKGLDLIQAVLPQHLMRDQAQFVVLGSGDAAYERFFRDTAALHPNKLAVQMRFDNGLAHRIEAGCDIFLMPSRYEPCGLNQMYSLKYGTVPLVRTTGGLADTITDATPQTLSAGTANGFRFDDYVPPEFDQALSRATNTWQRQEVWAKLVETGMRQDWSWSRSAKQYVELYRTMRKAGVPQRG